MSLQILRELSLQLRVGTKVKASAGYFAELPFLKCNRPNRFETGLDAEATLQDLKAHPPLTAIDSLSLFGFPRREIAAPMLNQDS